MHSTTHSNSNNRPARFGLTAVLFSLTLAILVFVGVASASTLAAPPRGPLAQATTAPGAPAPVSTSQVPDAVATDANGQPLPVATGDTATGPAQPNPGTSSSDSNTATATTAASSSGSGFPWLAAIILAVIVVLAVLGVVMMLNRRRSLVPVAATSLTPPTPSTTPTSASTIASTAPAATPPTTSTSTASTAPTAVPGPTAAAAAAAATSEAPSAPVTLPRALTCPNCSTVNDWSENFCHECGQDLRPLRASIIAAAAPPPDIVTDDMPYLETLDRTDEQLEYVLSRKKIGIGTAAGNDIMIDSSFKGYQSVSPRHAELRREGDGFLLVDLNSENGTFVNDARTGESLLAEGDQLRFGSVKFIYRVP